MLLLVVVMRDCLVQRRGRVGGRQICKHVAQTHTHTRTHTDKDGGQHLYKHISKYFMCLCLMCMRLMCV